MDRQRSLFADDAAAREQELEAEWGLTLDALSDAELMRLAYACYRGRDFPILCVRTYGRRSKLVRPELLEQIAWERAALIQ